MNPKNKNLALENIKSRERHTKRQRQRQRQRRRSRWQIANATPSTTG
jgi:hypothetical protein